MIDAEIEEILDRIADDRYSSADLRRLRTLIQDSGSGNAVQVGGYTVRLDRGRNIHVGDRVYRGADADAIRDVLSDVARQSGPQEVSRGSLRSFGGVVVAIGMIVGIIGAAIFAINFLSIWGSGMSGAPAAHPPPHIVHGMVTGFGMGVAGALITAAGQVIIGFERTGGRRR